MTADNRIAVHCRTLEIKVFNLFSLELKRMCYRGFQEFNDILLGLKQRIAFLQLIVARGNVRARPLVDIVSI